MQESFWVSDTQTSSRHKRLYGDWVYRFKKIIGNQNFSDLFKRIVNRFKRARYTLDIMRQTACLVFNPIMVEGYAALFSCTVVVQAPDSMTAVSCRKLYSFVIYLYVNGSGSITSVGEERANLSAVVYL